MAYAPVQLFAVPMEDYAAYWVKFYNQGTVTPLSMATDSTGGTLIVKAEVSSGGTVPIGFIKTAGDALLIPFVDGDYDCWLFPTAAEADANDTTNAIQVADNQNADPFAAGYSSDTAESIADLRLQEGTAHQRVFLLSYYAPDTAKIDPYDRGGGQFAWDATSVETDNGGTVIKVTAVTTGRWIRVYDGNQVEADWFGAYGDGTTDDTTAINNMMTYLGTITVHGATALETANKPIAHFRPCDGYYTSGVINCPAGVGMLMDGPIIRSGAAGTASPGLVIGSDITVIGDIERSQEFVLDVRRENVGDWVDQTDIGIEVKGLNVAKIWVKQVSGFAIGFQLTGAFNEITLGDIRNCGDGVLLTDTAAMFVNQNNFYGGEIAVSDNNNLNTSRYGVRIVYAGNFRANSNRFYGTSFESQSPTSGEQIPIICDGVWQTEFISIRYENTADDVIMQCSNDARWNTIIDSYQREANISRVDAIDDQSTYKIGNVIKHVSDPDPEDGFLMFDSGFLRDQVMDYDGTYNSIKGMECINNNGAAPALPIFQTWGNIDGFNDDGSVDLSNTTPSIFGVRLKTTRCKHFIVSVDGPVGFDGACTVLAFDSTGLQLTATGDVLVNAPTPGVAANTGVYGGFYSLGGQPDDTQSHYMVIFSDNVDVAFIGINGGSFFGMKIYGYGYGNANVLSSVSHYGDNFVASAIPTTGTIKKGTVIRDESPVASDFIGWVCTASGTFSTATDATGDPVSGDFIIAGMADTSDFQIGDFVTVSAGMPSSSTPYEVMAKTATSITLNVAATSSQTNVTIATVDPVLKTWGVTSA